MAEGGIDFTLCTVCLETLNNPRMLLCGHSFCTDCLKDILIGESRRCPDCGAQISDKSVEEDSPINYAAVATVNLFSCESSRTTLRG
ncbi:E3 ubiquitin-protein ligase TRIM56-like [Convolutriloba macropyga]|uniref:E3 ubiquitin-protein ligase TRIM56-like n=1 Tax=Convolutriloba macropyga TaxID=536237 RepID=UPI003F52065A